mgnify:CR=1 FL=1
MPCCPALAPRNDDDPFEPVDAESGVCATAALPPPPPTVPERAREPPPPVICALSGCDGVAAAKP